MFQIHINDLPRSLKFCNSILYADDTTIFLTGHSLKFLRIKLQSDLYCLECWLKSNSLKLNINKTKVMLLNKECLFPTIDLFFENEIIEQVSHFKFLGVTSDVSLDFSSHFSEVHSKLLCGSFVIRSLSKLIPLYLLHSLYFAYYHSHLSYCMSTWFPLMPAKSQNTIVILQKKIIRSLCNANYNAHCMPLYERLQILTVKDTLFVENVKLARRLVTGQCPVPILRLFDINGSKVSIPQHTSNKLNRSFLCKPLMEWQSLPVALREYESKKSFVKKVKDNIFAKY